jgi:hypothetical protein
MSKAHKLIKTSDREYTVIRLSDGKHVYRGSTIGCWFYLKLAEGGYLEEEV